MATTEERLAALEGGAAKAGWDGFGAAPVDDGSGNMHPREPVNPSGSTLPWNEQAGSAEGFVFQGPTQYVIEPPAGFTGMRSVSISQIPPQFDSVKVTMDADPQDLGGIKSVLANVWFADGAARRITITPSPANGSGRVQIVGGYPK